MSEKLDSGAGLQIIWVYSGVLAGLSQLEAIGTRKCMKISKTVEKTYFLNVLCSQCRHSVLHVDFGEQQSGVLLFFSSLSSAMGRSPLASASSKAPISLRSRFLRATFNSACTNSCSLSFWPAKPSLYACINVCTIPVSNPPACSCDSATLAWTLRISLAAIVLASCLLSLSTSVPRYQGSAERKLFNSVSRASPSNSVAVSPFFAKTA